MINITGGSDLGLFEINSAAELVTEAADPNANIIFGAALDESLQDEIIITVIATGFEGIPNRDPKGNGFFTAPSSSIFGGGHQGGSAAEVKPFAPQEKAQGDNVDIPVWMKERF